MPEQHTYTPSQIWIRGSLYLAASIFTEALSILNGEPVDWRFAFFKIAITGILTLRAYLDKTPAQPDQDNQTQETSP